MAGSAHRRFWVAIAAVAALIGGTVAQAARPLQSCADAGALAEAGTCCAKVAAPGTPAEKGAAACSMHCGSPGCAVVLAPAAALLKSAADRPAIAAAAIYTGWRPPPAAPPPRSLILV